MTMKYLGWAGPSFRISWACIFKGLYNIIECKASSKIAGLEIEKRTNDEKEKIYIKSRYLKERGSSYQNTILNFIYLIFYCQTKNEIKMK